VRRKVSRAEQSAEVMSQRRDDTTEEPARARNERERADGRYYYDDATGYEPFDPAQDEDSEADDTDDAPAASAHG
jgi:hypothetical protein